MKHPRFVLVALAWSFLLAWLPAGCGGGSAKVKVDVPAQIQNLKSDNAETRQQACVALGDAGEAAASAVKPLIPLLKDQDALVRRLAAYALGKIGPKAKEAIPALKEAINDADMSVGQSALGAIQDIDEKEAAGIKKLPNVTN